jgi:hypothetical protein
LPYRRKSKTQAKNQSQKIQQQHKSESSSHDFPLNV